MCMLREIFRERQRFHETLPVIIFLDNLAIDSKPSNWLNEVGCGKCLMGQEEGGGIIFVDGLSTLMSVLNQFLR